MAYAPRIRWADMVVPILISGLEALLKIGRHGLTQQFKKRAPALAADVGIDGFGEDLAERLYDGRSDWVHGSHVQLFAGPSPSAEAPGEEEPDEEAPEGPQSSDEQSAFAEVALLQDVLRAAVRRAIEDAEFRQVFVADERIAERWPA